MESTCIFEYRTEPSFGCAGMPGGYSVGVYDNGEVVRRDYVVAKEKPRKEVILATVPELAETIESIVSRDADELTSIPDNLNNGTRDGSHVCFRFGGKSISAWTIQRCDIEEVRQQNPEYYEEYKENMMFENLVLDIYDEIAAEINKYKVGIKMVIR